MSLLISLQISVTFYETKDAVSLLLARELGSVYPALWSSYCFRDYFTSTYVM